MRVAVGGGRSEKEAGRHELARIGRTGSGAMGPARRVSPRKTHDDSDKKGKVNDQEDAKIVGRGESEAEKLAGKQDVVK